MARIRELVLTGGPCAGKTTAITRLADELPEHGWRVLRAPELATMFITGGVDDLAAIAEDPGKFTRFQQGLAAATANLRASFVAMAEALGDDTLIVYDRAEPDASAYVDSEAYIDVLARLGMSPATVRDSYDAVVHLVTAADGAEGHYTTENNSARRESPEQARALDAATLDAWVGHPRLVVIDNRGSFEDKMGRVVDVALRLLGEPMPLEIERKYLLRTPPPPERVADMVTLGIEQRYVELTDTVEVRVRRQDGADGVTYTRTEKRPAGDDPTVRSEHEELVGYDTWVDAEGAPEVRKRRHVFIHDGQRFELDELLHPRRAWVLEVELGSTNDPVHLPDWLDIDREVTADPTWRNAAIAADAASGRTPA